MKTYIICNSKTGFTRRYADWIAEETGGTVLPYADFTKATIGPDDLVIFGSRLHAGRIEHLEAIKRRFKNRLIVFAVGGAPADIAGAAEKLWAENLSTVVFISSRLADCSWAIGAKFCTLIPICENISSRLSTLLLANWIYSELFLNDSSISWN